MPTRWRIAGSIGLLVLGSLGLVFLGGQVTQCLGPLGGRTFVESVRDGCLDPSVGPGLPLAALAWVAAFLNLLPAPGRTVARSLVGAAVAGAVGMAAYWVLHPTTLVGPATSGEILTIPLPLDRWALLATGIVGAGVGWLVGMWRPGPGSRRRSIAGSVPAR